MKLKDEIINKSLLLEYDRVCSKYSKQKILGTFVLGNANYGFADGVDELKFFSIYLPSFEELCWSGKRLCGEVLDIRSFYDIGSNEEYEFLSLEILFSKYFILNPKYENIFYECFLNKREQIGRFNDKRRIVQAKNRFDVAMEKGDYFEAARLWNGATLYMNNASLEECFCPTNPLTVSLMRALKDNLVQDPSTLGVNFDEYIAEASDENRFDAVAALKEGIIKIMEKSLEENISLDAFVTSLTKTEKEAFNFLQTKVIDNECTVSISNIIVESGISRPVFKSLLTKMENGKIAEVKNQGVNGTKIKFIY